MKNKLLRRLVWVLAVFVLAVAAPAEAGKFNTGWWCRISEVDAATLPSWAGQGQTMVLVYNCHAAPSSMITSFLDAAGAAGIKVIIGLTPVWEISASQLAAIVNAHKHHPALYAWYLADEPELNSSMDVHHLLAADPNYYRIIKANDPKHPVLISFNYPYNAAIWQKCRRYYDVCDIIGVHDYAKYAGDPGPWHLGEAQTQYDMWKQLAADAKAHGKDMMATCQGMSGGSYGVMSYDEMKHSAFTAVINGIDKILYWMWKPGFGFVNDAATLKSVQSMVTELNGVADEMSNGHTFSPAIRVNKGPNELAYRYGVHGKNHVIAAVNIKGRGRRHGGGDPLSGVAFTLPEGVDAASVNVLYENRSLPVKNRQFTDNFTKYQVHLYQFTSPPKSPHTAPSAGITAPR